MSTDDFDENLTLIEEETCPIQHILLYCGVFYKHLRTIDVCGMSMSFFVTNIVLAAVALVVFQLLPSPLDPVEWKQPNALPEFVGNAAVNTILSKSVVRSYDFSGPECFAANDVGEVYAGVSDGTVVVLGPDGKFISRLIFVGGMMLDKSGDGLGARSAALRETCRKLALTEELAWNTKQERECGRPLGLRFAKVKTTPLFVLIY